MAGYNELHGLRVKYLSADPSNAEDGQVWYNNTSGALRVQGIGTSSWSTSGNLPIATATASMFGTQNAAIYAAGQALTPGPAPTANTLEYGGLSWISLPTLASGARKELGGCGTTTAGLVFGGFPPTTGNTEEWNGSVWSEQNNLGTARYRVASAVGAPQTAALAVAGTLGSNPYRSNNVEEYDGSSWTAVTVLPTTAQGLGCAGTQTAFLGFGGYSPALSTASFEYDGTNWTSGGNLLVAAGSPGGAGTQTAALAFGGRTPSPTRLNTTVDYDGTSWSANPATLGTGRSNIQGTGAGSNTAASTAGGATATTLATTEEYNFTKNTITPAAWSSGGNMGTARYGGQYFGTGQTSQVAAGGHIPGSPPFTANSEEYNGTSWSEGNNLNQGRFNGAGGGTETAGVVAMGRYPTVTNVTEEYDGSSWTTVTASPETLYRKVGAGTQTALIITGGLTSSPAAYPTTSLEYDGTNWTSGGTAPFGGNYMDGVGTEASAVLFGGTSPVDPAGQRNNASYDYNGSAWTANNSMNIAHEGQHFACGTVTEAIAGGGGSPYAISATSETYDGTSFTSNAVLATSGQRGGKGTTTAGAIAVGGFNSPTYLNATEEYNVGSTTTGPASNITTS